MLVLRLLGCARLEREDGSPVPFQRRALAVLAVLAVADERGIGREQLAALFWPESAEEQAKGAVRQMLHVIRKAVGSADVVLGTSELRLNALLIRSDLSSLKSAARSGGVDVVDQLYAGPFLDGFTLGGCDQFNRWTDRERDRVVALVRDTFQQLAAQLTRDGAHAQATRWCRRIQDLDPLDAVSALALMRSLAAGGDPTSAVRHARLYSALLRAELDLEPDPSISELARALHETPASVVSSSTRVAEEARLQADGLDSSPAELLHGDLLAKRQTSDTTREIARRRTFGRRTAIVGLAASALVVLGMLHSSSGIGAAAPTMTRVSFLSPTRIAVLPLDVGDDTADEYLAEGVVDAIRSQLSSDSRLEVIGQASSDAYRSSKKSIDSIAEELRATYVATGRLSRSDTSLNAAIRLQFELRRQGNSDVAVAKQLVVRARDLAPASDTLADLVARHLGEVLVARPAPLSLTGERRAQAYDAFLRGELITEHDGTWEPARLQKASIYFAEAIRDDSLFVPAWAAMARAQAGLFVTAPSLTLSASSHRALARSLALAPMWSGSLLASSVVAHSVDIDNHVALAAAQSGLASAPRDADLLIAAGDAERSFGQWPSAFADYEKAVNIDPRSARASMKMIEWFIWQREYAKALNEANRGLAFAPDNIDLRFRKVMTQVDMGDLVAARATIANTPREVNRVRLADFFANWYDMGWVLDDSLKVLLMNAQTSTRDSERDWAQLAYLAIMRGDTVQGRAFVQHVLRSDAAEAAEFPSNSQGFVYLCLDLAFAGKTDSAVVACRKAITEGRRSGGGFMDGSNLYYLARVASMGGRDNVAIAALDSALKIPSFVSRDAIRINPNFVPLRKSAKFRALVGIN
jgi:DNA-binding SARP family transcriptional activator/TolB-like protein/tetratricopeptide (TPR) repeat protein